MFNSLKAKPIAVSLALVLFFPGCAQFKVKGNEKTATPASSNNPNNSAKLPKALAKVQPKFKKTETQKEEPQRPPNAVERIENLTLDDVIRWEEPDAQTHYDNSRYDFPIVVNSKVEGWIDYFTGRGRRHFERYLERSSRFIPVMKHIFRKEGLPEDLVYLAMIESGFNVRARSWARAVGPWQFMRATGSRYGLTINDWLDERRDPIKSTEAAAKYLKDLYLMFESWYLAASAYNAGENKILRAVDQLKTNNYWAISGTSYIRRETKDYIPKLIAAAILAKNPEQYGFEDIEYQDALTFEVVDVNFAVRLDDIARLINADSQTVLDLNPELHRNIVPPDYGDYKLRVPVGSQILLERALIARRDELAKPVQPVVYVVRSGDNLGRIASRFRVSVSDIMNMNNLERANRIYPGRSLMIPIYGNKVNAVMRSKASYTPEPSAKPTGRFVLHKVRRGETLWSIAEKHNVTVHELFRWNGLRRSRIHPGQSLKIRPKANEARVRPSSKLQSS